MNRTLLTALTLATLALSCAKAPTTARGGFVQLAKADARAKDPAPAVVVVAADDAKMPMLSAPGDYVVIRFSGSYRKTPLVLTERVLGRDGSVALVEMTMAEGKKSQTLRARIDRPVLGPEQVLDVVRVEKGKEHPATIAAYEAFMQKTLPDVDSNEETLGAEDATVTMGGKEMTGKVTRYKVRVAGKAATMAVFHANDFAWGDVAGEIVGTDGKVIYRAEVTDLGGGKTAAAAASR